MTKRNNKFIEVAFFLSKYGKAGPPKLLQTDSWKDAYRMFYEQLSDGRDILTFEHSLKNSRDTFDSHFVDTEREGWKDEEGNPQKLKGISSEVFTKFNRLNEEQIWERIKQYANTDVKEREEVFENLIAEQEAEKPDTTARTEGGTKVYISRKVERNPTLRNAALKIHGYDCKVCGFNFEKVYGVWGKHWAEVHHLKPISESKVEKKLTDPGKDLVVVCANCHRMIHRRRGTALTIEELQAKLILK
ncbi:hypothetical protein DR864_27435 [Runella rosea]|uniref:HNH nuclease domain-containing protein n=1 Tax=Runella rosea TaxID=2259595 RepID=A0A344TRD6_9BACT|nr:HNH endonuclease [Runella rosea]AXE21207.1 hypothetical protein DR864_27435 [Runella rosea]